MKTLALLTALACVALIGSMAHEWSFSITTMGGWLGFLLPTFLAFMCFMLGRIHTLAGLTECSRCRRVDPDDNVITDFR